MRAGLPSLSVARDAEQRGGLERVGAEPGREAREPLARRLLEDLLHQRPGGVLDVQAFDQRRHGPGEHAQPLERRALRPRDRRPRGPPAAPCRARTSGSVRAPAPRRRGDRSGRGSRAAPPARAPPRTSAAAHTPRSRCDRTGSGAPRRASARTGAGSPRTRTPRAAPALPHVLRPGTSTLRRTSSKPATGVCERIR